MDRRLYSAEPAFSGLFSRTVLLAAVLGFLVWTFGREIVERTLLDPDAVPRAVTPRGDLTIGEETTIELFQAAAPSVVHVKTSRRGLTARTYEPTQIPEGTGTGFVWDASGHIVTNFHVIRTAATADVYLQGDEDPYPARLVGFDQDADLAVLKIDAPAGRLRPIPIGRSHDLRVGQSVLAIGNPFGLDQTLTTGVISGLNRSIQSLTDMPIHGVIQTDAAINPGNSGGPLLDSAGRLIGVNTSIKSPTGAYAGVGFAVPVDLVNQRVPTILRDGVSSRAGLGIVLGPDKWALSQGIQGAVVDYVLPRSGAAAVGIRASSQAEDGSVVLGDVIVKLGDRSIAGRTDLLSALNSYGAGDVVTVTVSRFDEGRGQLLALPVELRSLSE